MGVISDWFCISWACISPLSSIVFCFADCPTWEPRCWRKRVWYYFFWLWSNFDNRVCVWWSFLLLLKRKRRELHKSIKEHFASLLFFYLLFIFEGFLCISLKLIWVGSLYLCIVLFQYLTWQNCPLEYKHFFILLTLFSRLS